MIPLDAALDRILRDREVREQFVAGRFDQLNVGPEDAEALRAIDIEQLHKMVRRIRDDVLGRRHRGSGGLEQLFPRTIAAWREQNENDARLDELTDRFLASTSYGLYREVPYHRTGACIEEAFYRFCEIDGVGDAIVRESEFLSAIVRALAVDPIPAFNVPSEVRAVANGWFALTTRGPTPMLHAAVRGRVITGELTPFLAELLAHGAGDAAPVARRHNVSADVLRAAEAQLRTMGLREAES